MSTTQTLPSTLIEITAADVFTPDGERLEQVLSDIVRHARAPVPDVTTQKGRKEIASLANKVARSKTYLDGLGKDLVSGLKKQAGQVDAQRRVIRERLDALKAEVRRPLTEIEEAEAERQARVREALAWWERESEKAAFIDPENIEPLEIEESITRIKELPLSPDLEEKKAEAQAIKDATLYRLNQKLDRCKQLIAEREQIKAEEEAKRRAEREAYARRMAEEAAAKARRNAEEPDPPTRRPCRGGPFDPGDNHMKALNRIEIIGRLGADPEVRVTQSGDSVATLSVATNEQWADRATGEIKELTEWHRVVLWQQLAEIAGKYLQKGSRIYAAGPIRTRKWTDQTGQERYSTEIRARDMMMLDDRQQQPQQAPQQPPAQPAAGPFLDDDIPF